MHLPSHFVERRIENGLSPLGIQPIVGASLAGAPVGQLLHLVAREPSAASDALERLLALPAQIVDLPPVHDATHEVPELFLRIVA